MKGKNRNWELLAKRLSGEIRDSEAEELNELMQTDGIEEAEYLIDAMDAYAHAIQSMPENKTMHDTTIHHKEKVMSLIATERLSTKMHPVKKRRYGWYAAAAIAVLLVGFFFLQQEKGKMAMNVVTTKNGSKSMVVLPDGTKVWLNADSRLSYANNFKEACIREVSLSGEAYFKVKHDKDHPFIIHTRYLDIKDLGTAFNVRAYPDEDKCEATLIEGSITVSLKSDPGKSLHLKPGEKVSFFSGKNKLVKNPGNNHDKIKTIQPIQPVQKLEVTHIQPMVIHPGDTIVSEIAWLDNKLVFNDETFSDLAKKMNRYFDTEIVFTGRDIQDFSFTGIFEGETLEQALKELQMICPFHYTMHNKEVVIRAKK